MRYFGLLELDEAASQASSAAFRFANFEIDVARHELRCGDKIIPIEPQVFRFARSFDSQSQPNCQQRRTDRCGVEGGE